MKKRLLGALALAAALLVSAVAASAGSSSPDRQTATKVVIWLQNDADSGWKQMVTSTNDAFRRSIGTSTWTSSTSRGATT